MAYCVDTAPTRPNEPTGRPRTGHARRLTRVLDDRNTGVGCRGRELLHGGGRAAHVNRENRRRPRADVAQDGVRIEREGVVDVDDHGERSNLEDRVRNRCPRERRQDHLVAVLDTAATRAQKSAEVPELTANACRTPMCVAHSAS